MSLRNFEEADFNAVQALMGPVLPAPLGSSDLLQPDIVKACLTLPGAFGLVAADDAGLCGMLYVLMEQETPETVVGLLTRFLALESPERAAMADSLLGTAIQTLQSNLQLCFAEIPSADVWAHAACENGGFKPSGYLPARHLKGEARTGAMVYAYLNEIALKQRRAHPELISSAKDLAEAALRAHGLIEDIEVRDDLAAYPTECDFTVAPLDASAAQMMRENKTQQQSEIFSTLQGCQTRLHLQAVQPSYVAAREGEKVVGAMGFIVDPVDRRVHVTEVMVVEGEPQGFLASSLFEALNREVNPDYWEVLVSAHSPRLQKTFDQMGFVPCAYLPAFAMEHGLRSDAIKMVKLNSPYESEGMELTSAGKDWFGLVDNTFREHAIGMAVLRLLKDLRIFQGMGEGELRRVARLFKQKLYRPGEAIFEAGSTGREMYVVERGEVEIVTGDGSKLLATIKSGTVFGEIAFLNGEPRTAKAVAKSAAILRVVERADFDKLIQRELHLGRVFFQNVALDLADKLKRTTSQAK